MQLDSLRKLPCHWQVFSKALLNDHSEMLTKIVGNVCFPMGMLLTCLCASPFLTLASYLVFFLLFLDARDSLM